MRNNCRGLENRCAEESAPGVQIPLPPLKTWLSRITTRNPKHGVENAPVMRRPVPSCQVTPSRCFTRSRLAHACRVTVILGAVGSVAVMANPAASAPCDKHEGAAKVACLKAKHERIKRDRMAWPPRPSSAEIIKRIGIDQWRKAERVAYCETGGNVAHYVHGKYIGLLGMYRGTYGMGVEWTKGPGNPRGYRWPAEGATKAEQIAVGYQVASRLGWSAWGCGGA